MPYDELDTLLAEETLRIEQFGQEARAQMRNVMRDIEREFAEFIDRMLREQAARLEAEAAALSPQGQAPAFHAPIGEGLGTAVQSSFGDSGSLLGNAFTAVLAAAAGSLSRGQGLNPRAIANAGGRVIAQEVFSSRPSTDSPRLSRAQMGEGLLRELSKAQRNG